MKYTLSMSEAEFLGVCTLMEGMLDVLSLRVAAPSVSVPAEPPLSAP